MANRRFWDVQSDTQELKFLWALMQGDGANNPPVLRAGRGFKGPILRDNVGDYRILLDDQYFEFGAASGFDEQYVPFALSSIFFNPGMGAESKATDAVPSIRLTNPNASDYSTGEFIYLITLSRNSTLGGQ